MPMDLCSPEFDIYQGAVAPNFLKIHTNSWCSDFFQKNVLSDVRSENHLFLRNIVTIGQSVRLKKILFKVLNTPLEWSNFYKSFIKSSSCSMLKYSKLWQTCISYKDNSFMTKKNYLGTFCLHFSNV